VIWAAKSKQSKHLFNYKAMRETNGGKQMKSVWRFTAPGHDEKQHGKHPTQKPVGLVERCILASTNKGDLVLDPFMGSGTTALACMKTGRSFEGIELESKYLDLARKRILAGSREEKDMFATAS
jgi:site-specific DNA-methyltransferase (adenine-specific)